MGVYGYLKAFAAVMESVDLPGDTEIESIGQQGARITRLQERNHAAAGFTAVRGG
jgi:hypothetical protein